MQSFQLIDTVFMIMLLITGLALVRLRSLFAAAMLTGVYSLISAAWFVSLDAVDVAFTEAAVGAGISTILVLSAMLLTAREALPTPKSRIYGPLFVTFAVGAALFYAISDMPAFGIANSPANTYVGMEYLERTASEIGIPNVVTAVLASYRGYDTLGETLVIFTAGLGVVLLLGLGERQKSKKQSANPKHPTSPNIEVLTETEIKENQSEESSFEIKDRDV